MFFFLGMSDEDVNLSPAHGDEAEGHKGASGGEESAGGAEGAKKGKEKKKAVRGKRMSPAQRMVQFPGEFLFREQKCGASPVRL